MSNLVTQKDRSVQREREGLYYRGELSILNLLDNFKFHYYLTLLGYFRPKHKDNKVFENHLNTVMLVFIV